MSWCEQGVWRDSSPGVTLVWLWGCVGPTLAHGKPCADMHVPGRTSARPCQWTKKKAIVCMCAQLSVAFDWTLTFLFGRDMSRYAKGRGNGLQDRSGRGFFHAAAVGCKVSMAPWSLPPLPTLSSLFPCLQVVRHAHA